MCRSESWCGKQKQTGTEWEWSNIYIYIYCPSKNSLHIRVLFLKLILNFHVSCTNQSCSRALPALNLCECRRTSLSGPAWTLSTGGLWWSAHLSTVGPSSIWGEFQSSRPVQNPSFTKFCFVPTVEINLTPKLQGALVPAWRPWVASPRWIWGDGVVVTLNSLKSVGYLNMQIFAGKTTCKLTGRRFFQVCWPV